MTCAGQHSFHGFLSGWNDRQSVGPSFFQIKVADGFDGVNNRKFFGSQSFTHNFPLCSLGRIANRFPRGYLSPKDDFVISIQIKFYFSAKK